MNARQRLRYARAMLMAQDRLNLKFGRVIARELRRVSKELAEAYALMQSIPDDISLRHSVNMQDILTDLAEQTGKKFLSIDLQTSQPLDLPTYLEQQVISTLQQNALLVAPEIVSTTVATASGVIAKGLEDGLTPVEIAKAIGQRIGGSNATARGMTIARTEVGKAANTATFERADKAADELQDEIVVKYEWISTNDGRVRDDHKHANGQIIDRGEKFRVGGEKMRYPQDPRASAKNVVNCRCVMGVIVEEIE